MQTYFVKMEGFPFLKIGRTNDLGRRLMTLQCGNPFPLQIIGYIEGDFEKFFHNNLFKRRVKGEWFFLKDEDLAEINMLLNHIGQEMQYYNPQIDSIDPDFDEECLSSSP